jgi:chromosomal replication initiator protein
MSRFSMSDLREVSRAWQAVLGRLELEITTQNFTTWLKGTRALRLEDDTLVVEARTAFNCDWLNQRLIVVVQRAVYQVIGEELRVLFVPKGAASGDELMMAPAEPEPPRAPAVVGSLNCAYSFERYVPAEGNRLAFECTTALVGETDFRISPVVVYGSPGMGKTHLLHALARRAANQGWAVACLNAEEFTSRYMNAIRRGSVEDFQLALRGMRLFVLDDLQYLAGKKGTLDELVHTIDAIGNAGGHVVVGSERHPAEIDLPERLASRLSAGIATRIEPFAMAERHDFVERLSRELRVALPAWAVDRIAGLEMPSVRILQGAANAAVTLQRLGQLTQARLDLELTRISIAECKPAVSADRNLLDAIARRFETTFEELVGRSRKPHLAAARAVAAATLQQQGRSLSAIASVLGGRDRSTISQLAERGRTMIAADSQALAS